METHLRAEFPDLLKHLESNCLVIQGTFTGHIMTFGLNSCPMEISTRLFEIFILDGEHIFIRVLLRMLELKQREILKRDDTDLQRYILSEIMTECIQQYPMATLAN